MIIKWPSDCCCIRIQGFETRVLDAVKPSVLVSKSGTSQSNRDMHPNLTPILERKGDKQRSKVLTPRVGRERGAGELWSLCKLQRNDSRHLRFGNLFTSLQLVDCPTKKGTYRLTGTIHVDRSEDTPLMPVNTVPNMACADPGQFKQPNDGQKPRERGERSHSLDRILKWSCISQLYYCLGQPYS